MMSKKLQDLVGMRTEHRRMSYTWRDMALYALAVGAKADDLQYTYEKNMKALPTFGVLPYWGTVNVEPPLSCPRPAALLAADVIGSTIAPLHMEHELVMHHTIPTEGALLYQDVITDVYDRGEGKGAVIRTCCQVFDEAETLLCTNTASTLFQEGGGFGGQPMPHSAVQIPNQPADQVFHDHISPVQNLLYRLTGDTNLVHVDPDYARTRGFDRVFMQGLCSFGFACRMAVQALIPGEPERMTRIAAQMRSILYIDTPIRFELWKTGDHAACFRLLNAHTNAAVLDRGVFEWQSL